MKRTIALITAALLGLVLAACGQTSKPVGSEHQKASGTTAASAASTNGVSSAAQASSGDLEANYDLDDGPTRGFGQEASSAETRAIAALVKRYYAAGAREDGAAACALTSAAFAKTIPDDYVQELGSTIPSGATTYLRGAKTCAAVLSLLFEHDRSELAAPIEVTGVRLKGDYGYAMVDSTTLPASLIEVGREQGVWRIDELLGRPFQ